MNDVETRSPKMPPRWFVHTFWRMHRGLYRLSRGRFLWTTASKRGWGALHLTTVGRKVGQGAQRHRRIPRRRLEPRHARDERLG